MNATDEEAKALPLSPLDNFEPALEEATSGTMVLVITGPENDLMKKVRVMRHLIRTMGKNGIYIALKESSGYLNQLFTQNMRRPVQLRFIDFHLPARGTPSAPEQTVYVYSKTTLSEFSILLNKAIETGEFHFVFLDEPYRLVRDRDRDESERFLKYLVQKLALFNLIGLFVIEPGYNPEMLTRSAARHNLRIIQW